MKLPRCTHCTLPVLELEGQSTRLDSLYVNDGVPPPETAGRWHARCLVGSDVGPPWYEARLRNFRDVRRYQEIVALADWTVLRDPNRGERLAFGRRGELLGLSRGNPKAARAVPGGAIFPKMEDAFHLEPDDLGLVQRIQDGLTAGGSFPLTAVLEGLGIADRTVHPEALEGAALRFDDDLQEYWGRSSVSARAEYGVFVPDELLPHVGEFIR